MSLTMRVDDRMTLRRREGEQAHRQFSLASVVGMAVVIGVTGGCSQGVERVKVSGQILIDGEPLPAGFIRVYPKGVRSAASKIDSEGRFNLTSFTPGDGIALGTHVVTVNGSKMLNARKKQWYAPKRYSRVSSSGLMLEVTGSTEDAVINLAWDGGKPFIENMGDFNE